MSWLDSHIFLIVPTLLSVGAYWLWYQTRMALIEIESKKLNRLDPSELAPYLHDQLHKLYEADLERIEEILMARINAEVRGSYVESRAAAYGKEGLEAWERRLEASGHPILYPAHCRNWIRVAVRKEFAEYQYGVKDSLISTVERWLIREVPSLIEKQVTENLTVRMFVMSLKNLNWEGD